MKRENLENALASISDEILAESAVKATPKRRRVKLPRIIVPAAVVAMLMATLLVVNAAAPVDLSFYVTSQFGGGYDMLDEMTSLPTTTTTRYSSDDIKFELKGVIGDVAVAYIYFDVIVSPDVALPERINFDYDLHEITMPWDSISHGYSFGELSAPVVNDDGSITHKCYVNLSQTNLNTDAGYTLSGRAFSLSISRIFKHNDNHEEVTLLEGKWSIGFVLNYKDLTDIREINEDITISRPALVWGNDVRVEAKEPITVTLDRLTISPLSAGIYITFPEELHVNDQFPLEMFDEYVGLRMKDGSVAASTHSIFADEVKYKVNRSSSGQKPGKDGAFVKNTIITFAEPIDLTEVAAFIISDVEIPLGE